MNSIINELVRCFRQRADDLHMYLVNASVPWEQAAALLQEGAARYENEALDLPAAAAESGYTVGHLRRLLGHEPGYPSTIPNAGTPEEPKVLRRDLPRKPGHRITELPGSPPPRDSAVELPPGAPQSRDASPAGAPVAQSTGPASSFRTQVARAVAAGD